MIAFIKKNYVWGILILLLWGFFYLIEGQAAERFTISFFLALAYAVCITLILYLLHTVILPKIRIFSFRLQLVLKSFFYASGILIGYLLVKIPEILLLQPYQVLLEKTIYGFLHAITALFTAPFNDSGAGAFISRGAVTAAVSFFALLFLIALVSILFSYVETRWRAMQMERQQQQARLRMLEMQMQPHFLFNTINSIVSIVQSDPSRAEKLLISLSDFLRYNFSLADKQVAPLKEELDFSDHYLELMNARFAGRIHWEKEIDKECMKTKIPVMLLQPVLENSVKHGWKETDKPLSIRISCYRQNQATILEVQDNGEGFPYPENKNFPPAGHSLDIIRQRLRLIYGKDHLLQIRSAGGAQVRLIIPEHPV